MMEAEVSGKKSEILSLPEMLCLSGSWAMILFLFLTVLLKLDYDSHGKSVKFVLFARHSRSSSTI